MNVMTVNEAKADLEQLIRRTVNDVEQTVVVTDDGFKVVFVSLDEFNSWQETLYLLSTPENAAHLRRSIAEARAGIGRTPSDYLMKIAFTPSAWADYL